MTVIFIYQQNQNATNFNHQPIMLLFALCLLDLIKLFKLGRKEVHNIYVK